MSIAEVKKNIEHKMGRSIDAFKQVLAKIRMGRAHTGLLEHIQVDYYGSHVPLSQVANLTLIDARTIGVQPWEKKMVSVVEKAIRESDLGLNPATHGELLRVPMPALTEERRRELTKVVKSEGETAKIVIRGLRRDAKEQLDKLVKDEGVPEDSGRRAQDDVQKLTDKFVSEIDELVQTKSSEIMKV
ncbi:ribosome recycling factor [Mycoavidus sp. B2-EB]|uniref:ribosome recycling factor n=1 Tax=Mycoavidus sp. B2-EB TaxID=2651972 RepID=UPI00162515F2|nr:ribosome recycling factor [Mycoavidus sp. B2-EB]BBO59560.1 ribosome-recycling factor [Mycoavidus sp. B2-EB]